MKFKYPFLHWLTTLGIVPPFLIIYYSYTGSDLMTDPFETCVIFILVGLVLSLPVLLVYLFAYNKMIKSIKSDLSIKIILDAAAVIGVIVTFAIIEGTMAMKLAAFYSVGIIVTSTFFRLRP